MKNLTLVFILGLIVFSSCMDQSIKSSSREAYNESVSEMMKDLDYIEQVRLLENMQIIAFEGVDMNAFVKSPNKEDIHYDLHMSKLGGMNMEEIMEKGEEITNRKVEK